MKAILNRWWVLAVLFTACSPRYVANSDFARGVNFQKYHTYQIEEAKNTSKDADPILDNEFNRKRIRTAIESQMEGRKYEKAAESPDLLVRFYNRVRERQEVMNNNNNWNPWMRGPWGWGNSTYVRNYEENTLIIEVVDAKTNELLWQGWTASELKPSKKNQDMLMAEKVALIFQEFPVKPADVSEDPLAYH
jgi:hypothetical protein